MEAARLRRLTVSDALAPTCGRSAARASRRSCSLCETPRLARITWGFCFKARLTASLRVSFTGADSCANPPDRARSKRMLRLVGILGMVSQCGECILRSKHLADCQLAAGCQPNATYFSQNLEYKNCGGTLWVRRVGNPPESLVNSPTSAG